MSVSYSSSNCKISKFPRNIDADADMSSPLYGTHICFTGTLQNFSRKDAAIKAISLGAVPQDSVTKDTDYLVVGRDEFVDPDNGILSGKLKRAGEYIKQGIRINVIREDDFVSLFIN
jgi:DNA polymerase III subunit epsilon